MELIKVKSKLNNTDDLLKQIEELKVKNNILQDKHDKINYRYLTLNNKVKLLLNTKLNIKLTLSELFIAQLLILCFITCFMLSGFLLNIILLFTGYLFFILFAVHIDNIDKRVLRQYFKKV